MGKVYTLMSKLKREEPEKKAEKIESMLNDVNDLIHEIDENPLGVNDLEAIDVSKMMNKVIKQTNKLLASGYQFDGRLKAYLENTRYNVVKTVKENVPNSGGYR